LLLLGGALLTGCDNKEPSEPPVIVIEKEAMTVSRPAMRRIYLDCEDTTKTPCVTFDDGKWRKVTDYSPYKYTKIKRPTKVRGGYVLGSW
jgi:hypothetical protein